MVGVRGLHSAVEAVLKIWADLTSLTRISRIRDLSVLFPLPWSVSYVISGLPDTHPDLPDDADCLLSLGCSP